MADVPVLTLEQKLIIHKALHGKKADGTPFTAVRLGGKVYRVNISPQGLRNILIIGLGTFWEQNKQQTSKYAIRARAGEKLTWFIPITRGDSWELFTGEPDSAIQEK